MTRMELFTAHAMLCAITESQETVPDGFWNWIKEILRNYAHLSFLVVRYRQVENAHQEAAKRAVDYAEAICKELDSREPKK